MLGKISKILVKIFGSRNERLVKSFSIIAEDAGEFEQKLMQLDDEALKAKTTEFREKIKSCTKPEDVMPEAFAVVREAARRNIQMRHFDVQLIGGDVLYQGKIAEMATGEGKTLVATLAAYMVCITGRRVHIVTVNDYLAKRDAEWMGPVYQALGLTVGAIQADMDTGGDERKKQYDCDITYGTNNEFGFDYLRDNMKTSIERMVQGDLQYAIIDEVDSILIDEARTPLIISGPAFDDVSRYKRADSVAKKLISLQGGYDRLKKQIDSSERTLAGAQGELSEAKRAKDDKRIEQAQRIIEKSNIEFETSKTKLEQATQYYEVEYDKKAVHLTHEGIGAAQEEAGVGSFFTGSNMEWPHLLEQSLRAHITFEREKDYVVMEGKVIIVDEFTGRLMHGRQWSDGLHQAVEAKEGVTVKEETQTLATITLQNFFKLYNQIAGMTGTAATEAEEFLNIYKLEVVIIPTNKPCIRDDSDDVIYKSMKEKFDAVAEQINEISQSGRPLLIGTISIEKSEALSAALTKRFGLDHEVLNAKQHAREAVIVAKAGQQHEARDGSKRGNVTIATNMAGRGTDIKLGPGVAQIGGLHILGTERHEARRIDNQLRGRAGRQGDAGSSQFFLSFDDDLMSIFAPEWTVKALSWIGWEEGQPIYHKRISKGIEKAQKKVEEKNFDVRKSLLEYDEVMDYQRKIFYSRRRKILSGRGLKPIIQEMIDSAIEKNCKTILDENYPQNCIIEWARTNFGIDLKPSDVSDLPKEEIEAIIKQKAKDNASNNISISMGEYFEDYEDSKTWDISGLCKWAMSAFQVSLSLSKIKTQSPEEIEQLLTQAAWQQIDKKDCVQLADFLNKDYSLRMFTEWAKAKFAIKLETAELTDLNASEIRKKIEEKVSQKYKQREIEYPVEFAMNMAYGPQGPNIYGYEALAKWANKKYNADFSVEKIQEKTPKAILNELLDLSSKYNNGELEREISEKAANLNKTELLSWANQRFQSSLTDESFAGDQSQIKDTLTATAKEFLRIELSDLEKYVLIQVYDSTWKDHLYSMDHLKSNVWMRSFAEKDPKTEYKHEGYRMFEEMLSSIEDRVTDIIFKVHLESGARAREVWNVSRTSHDEVGQFAMAAQQRAAAQAPQGETVVKQIKLETPKVGRNDPCPCGSGKKYKKCHGKNE
ncbi:MAG: preprotein translocase subunit SecA [Sedimentisphaerales bacterium]|nr:preprotein translocase subunit SecA [Sedimentisphaerales bacterium]